MTPPKDQTPTPLHPDRSEMLDALASLTNDIKAGRIRGLRLIWDDGEGVDYDTLGTWDRGGLIYAMKVATAVDEEADRLDLEAEIALLRSAVEEG